MVRIAPDTAIVAKGRQPFQTQYERARTVLAIGAVDDVRCGELSLEATVRTLRPRYLVKGTEWNGLLPLDVLRACQQSNTEIIFVKTRERSSTERLAL